MAKHCLEVYLDGEGFVAGPSQALGSIPAVYNLTMNPFERYDMIFNGAEGENEQSEDLSGKVRRRR